jgi:DNA-binding NtrC family response regulator
MPATKAKLLIVDDELSIRTSLSQVLTEIGHCVRSANDGFAALLEIRQEIPGILISDLNMPGISGFELLSEVRRNFPSIKTIAMSGSFSGDEVPSGVVADAFYEKGSSIGALLQIIGRLLLTERRDHELSNNMVPISTQQSWQEPRKDVRRDCPLREPADPSPDYGRLYPFCTRNSLQP